MAYTTATDIQYELRAASAFSDTTVPSLATVTDWIEQADSMIDGRLGMSYESTEYTEIFDFEGNALYVRNTPIISVDSLSYNTASLGTTPVWEDKTGEDINYTIYEREGRVAPIIGNFTPKIGRKNIKITYTAGYETVPASIKQLSTKMVADRALSTLISQNVNERNDGGSISVGSINIVEPASYGVNSYKQLKSDIDSLWQEVLGGFRVHRYG